MLTGVNSWRLVRIDVNSLSYILVVWKEPVSLKCQKEINQLKIKDMIKYYVNGKEITEQEANEIKKENARLQKSLDLNDWLGIQWITEIKK